LKEIVMTSPQDGRNDTARGFVLSGAEGEAYDWLGSLTITKVSSRLTRGGLSIVDHRVPAGYAPPPHIHHQDDEVFYVLGGQFIVRCGPQTWQAGPDSLVFLPREVPHGFVVSDDGPGRTLLLTAPGGFDELVSDLGTPTIRLTLPSPGGVLPSPERIAAASAAHDISPAIDF